MAGCINYAKAPARPFARAYLHLPYPYPTLPYPTLPYPTLPLPYSASYSTPRQIGSGDCNERRPKSTRTGRGPVVDVAQGRSSLVVARDDQQRLALQQRPQEHHLRQPQTAE